jgi:hypothetical protein
MERKRSRKRRAISDVQRGRRLGLAADAEDERELCGACGAVRWLFRVDI